MTRTVGVEEELLLVDAETATPRAVAGAVLADAPSDDAVVSELQAQQVETNSNPCTTRDELFAEVRTWRRRAAELARAERADVAALGTSPVPIAPEVTPKGRYQRMADAFGLTAQEALTCGCHVHVAVESDEEGVAVLDRIRVWLAPLLALSVNSPIWQGQDSGYASYRHQVFGRWPCTGPQEVFGSAEAYHDLVSSLLGTGTLLDQGMVYFDARLSAAHPTVEVRVCDVCPDARDAVVLALLVRGLVETAARAWQNGEPPPRASAPLLRLAAWRASRSGPETSLVHPGTQRQAAAREVVGALVEHVAPVLAETGDLEPVREGVARLLSGGGARWQRELFARRGPTAVIREAVALTRK